MNEERIPEGSSWSDPLGQVMKTPDDAAEMRVTVTVVAGAVRIRHDVREFDPNAAHRFFQWSAAATKPNRSVAAWGAVFADLVVATAILDRLLHHCRVLTMRATVTGSSSSDRAGSSSRPLLTALRSAPPPSVPSAAEPTFNRHHELEAEANSS